MTNTPNTTGGQHAHGEWARTRIPDTSPEGRARAARKAAAAAAPSSLELRDQYLDDRFEVAAAAVRDIERALGVPYDAILDALADRLHDDAAADYEAEDVAALGRRVEGYDEPHELDPS